MKSIKRTSVVSGNSFMDSTNSCNINQLLSSVYLYDQLISSIALNINFPFAMDPTLNQLDQF